MKYLQEKIKSLTWVFVVAVLAPTTLAILYFGFLASDVYVSESSFIVKSSERKSPSGLGSLLGNVAGAAGYFAESGEVYTVQGFAESRDAMNLLNKGSRLAQLFSAEHVSLFDRFAPLSFYGSQEDLYRYYQKHITIEIDSRSSLAKLRVDAYRPQDAQWINAQLLQMSEDLVNRLNKRAEVDLIAFAGNNQREAAARARSAALDLAVYRNSHAVLDPEKQASVQLQLIAKLQDDLIATQSQLDQVQAAVPGNPQIEPLKVRIGSIKRQIKEEEGRLTGGNNSYAGAAPEYQRLLQNSQIADRQLASAMAAVTDAREEANRKRIYIETVVKPSLPDSPAKPRRLNSILATLIIGIMAWGIFSMLFAGIREHGY